MAIYQVEKDGKAPSGLKKGDLVVTGGGTYKITGTNSDGSYKSTKTSGANTSNYTGSYANSPSSGGGSYKPSGSTYGSAVGSSVIANNKTNGSTYSPLLGSLVGANTTKQNSNYEPEEQKPVEPQRDPRIDELLNQILNREDFSYDVMNDPLYQQYAQMYQREGDRAMKETMAEAAAGAGGMNTYAITAAQQANNYYNSQLNDKIPQLYQLAYDMYLNDKESKVQDLGILQDMDATQYNRYRDTINDYYADKNFAYNAYQDAVQQGNWEKTFNYNSKWDDINFDNSNYWKEKEWNANQDEIDYNKNQYDKETARELVMWYIENGNTSISPELIQQAGLNQADVNLAIAAKQAELTNKSKSSSDSKDSYIDYDDLDDEYVLEKDGYYNGDKLPNENEVVVDGVKIPKSEFANVMTEQEWYSRRGSHEMSGSGGIEVAEYNTYKEYYKAMLDYLKLKYSEN